MSRTVLVARLDSAGDVLLSGPAVRAIAASAEVELLCGPRGAEAGALLPRVARTHVWAAPWIVEPAPPVTPAHVQQLAQLVRRVDPDEAIVLTSFHQSPLPLALLLRLAGVGRITGASVDYAGSLLDVRLRPGEDFPEEQSEVARALGIAAAAGYPLPAGDDGRLAVTAPPDTTGLTGRDPYVVVHPGAAVPARMWPAGHHRATVRLLRDRGLDVVVTGSGTERALTAEVAGGARFDLGSATDLGGVTGLGSVTDLGGATDLAGLAGVLAGAAAVVVGNTGAAHLAAAVGTPVVSLFSPVVSERCWRPYGVPVVVFGRTDAGCAGTRARSCPVPGHPCLSDVTPAAVADAVVAVARTHATTAAEVVAG
ncbi:glycosyltransferase family 9 protein [Agromyces aerolatus]|uniref:glycosyltransferase family 9 protein n=1 Tax=Agromyces sp. LY-1074 TaxID=3074080 RepID=UPI00285A84B5|nr:MULTISPECIES: glycosyltransferase family 9 protein [unclassified Agromyces]MDR5700589.1 glycosyltransferase family 9 protein [Agromyces sp. LY-1074]MDR5707110.1 glycosyltransferase family 9 protein [Agromyces sp. LY-1358]